jgi:hypothetical protein
MCAHIMCRMNITLSIDEQTVKRAREKLQAVGKSVNEEIREHLSHIAGGDNGESDQWQEELRNLSGRGNPEGWRFSRDEIYERR